MFTNLREKKFAYNFSNVEICDSLNKKKVISLKPNS